VEYGIGVYAGVVVWSMVQDSALQSLDLYREYRPYLIRFRVPLWCYGVASSGVRALVLSVGLGILTILSAVFLRAPSRRLAGLFVLIPALLVLSAGTTWLAAFMGTREPRSRFVLPQLMMLWFFATPVVYPRAVLPPLIRRLLWLNPAAHLVECFQWVWLPSRKTDVVSWIVVVVASFAVFVLGWLSTKRYAGHIVDSI
jgi:lipopolysaccharide transport system permease protein